jgi:hypothetical protein
MLASGVRSGSMEQPDDRLEVRLAGVPLGKARHICALFHDRDEWLEVLLPFVREGLHPGEKEVDGPGSDALAPSCVLSSSDL